MASLSRRLWFAVRIAAALLVAGVAIATLASWVLALLLGGVTIAAVVLDGVVMQHTPDDQVAVETLTVDLRRRR